jgi:class 3 adenylate cyclase
MRLLALLSFLSFVSTAAMPLVAQNRTIDSLEAVLKRFDAEGRQDTSLVRVLNRLAFEFESNNPPKCLQYLSRARELAEKLGDRKGFARSLHVRGTLEMDNGNFDTALEYFFKSLSITEELKELREQSFTLNNIGITYRKQGKYELAVEYYTKSLRIKEALGDKRRIAATLSNVGNVYKLQGKYEQALEYEIKSLTTEQEAGNKLGQASSYNNIGEIYLLQKKPDRALDNFFKSKVLKEEIGDNQGLVTTLTNIGQAYRLSGKTQYALRFYQEALALSEQLGNKDGAIACFDEVAEFLTQTGNPRAALVYATRAYTLADSIGAKPRVRDALESLSRIYASLGDHKQSLEYYKHFVAVRDSVVNAESVLQVATMQAKYQTDSKDQQIKLLNEQQRFQTLLVNSLVGGVVFLLALGVVFLRMYRLRRRSEQELRTKNEEITRQQKILEDQATEIELANTELHEKNVELEEAREQSDRLLLNVLPTPIATRLKAGERTIADSYDSVTVLFADIVDFTKHSSRTSPERLVGGLNAIFVGFDELAKKHGLEKIKTIGDAYMLAGGLPERSYDHCERVARFALEAMESIATSDSANNASNEAGSEPIQLRIGIHTGSAVAGVIGTTKFTYDLWGDTVNTASRMESHGIAGKIHCTEEVYVQLVGKFRFEERGLTGIKGKGIMHTYFLTGAS